MTIMRPSPYLCAKFIPVLLKKTVVLVLLGVLLAQTFNRYILVADYYLNTAAYIQSCVNKDKPAMHCNGRCQLCRKMQQQEKQERQSPQRRIGLDGVNPFSSKSSFIDMTGLHRIGGIAFRFPEISVDEAVGMHKSVFHPPDFGLM
jgi:hypothetical protein